MANYECLNCKKVVKSSLLTRRVRCHYCGHKILKKVFNSEKPRKILAR